MTFASLLETPVVVRADPSEHRDLLAAQACHASRADGREADVTWLQASPACLQELSEGVPR